MFFHFVKKGDNLYNLSKLYEVPLSRLIQDNLINNPNNLSIGDCLIIRKDPFIYTSKSGDTFSSISKKYNINEEKLRKDNKSISEPIKENSKISIMYESDNKDNIKVNGYTYPTIKDDLLEKTLPYLTYLSIFAYKFDEDGELSTMDEERIIQKARMYNVSPIMVITNVKEKGGFSPRLVHSLLSDNSKIDTFLNDVLKILKDKNYHGVNIDFEYIYEDDKDLYESFMKKAYDFFSSKDYLYLTSFAPKNSDNQKGLLYTSHDYNIVEEYNDLVILMTYEWGYTYSESMPVSPINKVEDVIKYAVSKIDSDKILMGIPNYGYDFTLPYEKNKAAKSLSLSQAKEEAFNKGVEIKYDNISQTPYYKYKENGTMHEVQFDNAYSFYKKLELVDEYNLEGISIWTIKTYNPAYYLLLNHFFNIEKVL